MGSSNVGLLEPGMIHDERTEMTSERPSHTTGVAGEGPQPKNSIFGCRPPQLPQPINILTQARRLAGPRYICSTTRSWQTRMQPCLSDASATEKPSWTKAVMVEHSASSACDCLGNGAQLYQPNHAQSNHGQKFVTTPSMNPDIV